MKKKLLYILLPVLLLLAFLSIIKPKEKEGDLAQVVEYTSKVSPNIQARSNERSASKPSEDETFANRDLEPKPFNQAEADLRNDPNDPESLSEFDRLLDNPDLTESASVEALSSLVLTYRQLGNGGYYDSGENIEITNALLGDNPKKVAFISAENSRINSKGELVDRFGVPYDFHFISSKNLIIRSAGPDQTFYTDDDIVSANEAETAEGTAILGNEVVPEELLISDEPR